MRPGTCTLSLWWMWLQPCKRTTLDSSYGNQNHNHNSFTVCPPAQTLNSVQWLILREWPEALAMCIYSHINVFKTTLKAWSTSCFVRCIQWSCNILLSRKDGFVNLFLTFIWIMAKKVLFYGHYVVFPTIFFHLLGALPGNTLGHNSVLEGNSDDEPYFCKDSLTLICHMWSLCVRLKMGISGLWTRTSPSQDSLKPWELCLSKPRAAAGVWLGSRDDNYLSSRSLCQDQWQKLFCISWISVAWIYRICGRKKMFFKTQVYLPLY